MRHEWQHKIAGKTLWVLLEGKPDQSVRCKPDSEGRYMWQFRKTVGYTNNIPDAIAFVEAGAEFFNIMHRNPYA